jgi:DNA-binding response OmpR family regulator
MLIVTTDHGLWTYGRVAMKGYRILVVEDDPASQDVFRRLFAHRGWVVSVARTVAEGMAKLDTPPHCILLDLTLPDGEGEAILRKVREGNLPSKVAVCTGTDDPVRLAMVKGMRPEALFRKPLDFDEVCRAVESDTAYIEGPSPSGSCDAPKSGPTDGA